MILRPFLIFVAFLASNVLAQTAPAPPRTVEDILAVLDQYQPDPAAVERLRAAAVAEPPVTSNRQDLAIFYHRRARANESLGRLTRQIADLNKALEHVLESAVSEREGIGDRYRMLNDLAIAEFSGGNLLRAIDASKKLLANTWHQIAAFSNLVGAYASLGDLPAARQVMRDADSKLVSLRSTRAWSDVGNTWQRAVVASHAKLLEAEGNFGEAERRWRAAIELSERSYNDARAMLQSDPGAAMAQSRVVLNWASVEASLAGNLRVQGRGAEAEYYSRSGLIRMLQAFGRYSVYTASFINGLGRTVFESGRFADAAALAQAAIESYEKAGAVPESLSLAGARSLLGTVQVAQSRWAEAISVFEARNKGLATDPVQYARYGGRNQDWGIALLRTGDTKKALAMIERVYRNQLRRGLTDSEYFTAQLRGFYAMALAADGRVAKALVEFRGAVPVLLAEARHNANAEQGGNVAKQMRLVWILEAYIKLLLDLRDSALLKDAGIDAIDEAFRLADVARGSSVQRALAESAARATPGDPALAELARREQDTQKRFVTLSDLLNRLLSMPPEQQLPKIIVELKRDIEVLRVDRERLKQDLGQRFPDYADLIDPRPPALAEVQSALGNDEALISIYVSAERSYVWAVPKSGKAAFASVALSDAQIAESVAQLRKALDVGEVSLAVFPRFDLARSHELHAALLRPVESGWREAKSLIVVPHKALAQLPFALLTTASFAAPTKAVQFEEYRQVPWLIRSVSLSQLPSVSTLLALRRVPAARTARKEFIGFGDPLFSKEMALAANDAGSVTRGVKLRNLSVVKVASAQVAMVADAPAPLVRATVANSSRLAQLARLPDTAEEIQSIAQALRADPSGDVFLGRAASEKNVKSGQLTNRRIVMFATHGLVPGDLDGLTQPALALSAPEVTGNADEDGLLTMEEVLGLKLNADWVVLSACNTASGDGAGSEAVSGLGKAFFYAGARSLLVSNWPVETVSARLLTTKLFEQQAANPSLSRAEALRGTMLELIDHGESGSATSGHIFAYAHPMFWAPFSLVGDGGR